MKKNDKIPNLSNQNNSLSSKDAKLSLLAEDYEKSYEMVSEIEIEASQQLNALEDKEYLNCLFNISENYFENEYSCG